MMTTFGPRSGGFTGTGAEGLIHDGRYQLRAIAARRCDARGLAAAAFEVMSKVDKCRIAEVLDDPHHRRPRSLISRRPQPFVLSAGPRLAAALDAGDVHAEDIRARRLVR